MKTNKYEEFKKLVSDEKSTWIDDLNYFEDNSEWLDISFEIALSVMSKLLENKKKKEGIYNQKMLASALGCSAQYVTKLLKGNENLTLATICNLQNALDLKLIEVTKYEAVESYSFSDTLFVPNQEKITQIQTFDSFDYEKLLEEVTSSADNTSYALAA
jgi:transcriptional regulator with XRE-family HTH domain